MASTLTKYKRSNVLPHINFTLEKVLFLFFLIPFSLYRIYILQMKISTWSRDCIVCVDSLPKRKKIVILCICLYGFLAFIMNSLFSIVFPSIEPISRAKTVGVICYGCLNDWHAIGMHVFGLLILEHSYFSTVIHDFRCRCCNRWVCAKNL